MHFEELAPPGGFFLVGALVPVEWLRDRMGRWRPCDRGTGGWHGRPLANRRNSSRQERIRRRCSEAWPSRAPHFRRISRTEAYSRQGPGENRTGQVALWGWISEAIQSPFRNDGPLETTESLRMSQIVKNKSQAMMAGRQNHLDNQAFRCI